MTRTDLEYRKAAADGTNGFGVLIALYDTLAGDLRRAAEAEHQNDIEKRCLEVNHALLVVGHLEDWVARGSDGELAQQLVAFYASLRRKLIEAQVTRSAQVLEQQMDLVLDLREHWQKIDLRAESTEPEIMPPVHAQSLPAAFSARAESRRGSWSA
jgi:flagellar secretion chaperone FliS